MVGGKKNMGVQEFILEALRLNVIFVNKVTGVVYNRYGAPWICISTRGYRVGTVHINGTRKQLKAHQVVWLSVHGAIPTGVMLDHINRDKLDNRILNLRLATSRGNSLNRRSYKGDQNPSSKITQEVADLIRTHYAYFSRSYRQTAESFQVSKSLVAQIIKGKLWPTT